MTNSSSKGGENNRDSVNAEQRGDQSNGDWKRNQGNNGIVDIMVSKPAPIHQENVFPGSGCSRWIWSTNPIDCMSLHPELLQFTSISLG